MDHHSPSEQAWLDHLLGEIKDPEAEAQIRQRIEEDEDAREAYENLGEMIRQLEEYYTNERDPMFDLTYEQKEELYSSFTDIFPRSKKANISLSSQLRLLFASLGFAALVMATVPIVQMITIKPNPPTIPTGDPTYINDAPEVFEAPPEPPEPKDQDETEEPPEIIMFRDIEDMLTPPVDTGGYTIRGIDQFQPDMSGINIGDDIMNMIDVDVVPSPLTTVAPPYPPAMRQSRIEGKVVLEFVVDENGYVRNPVIVRSDNPGFNRVALDTIRKWRFEPGQKDSKVVKVRMRMPFVFNLK